MNLKQTVFALTHTHLGDVLGGEYNIWMATKKLTTDIDIVKESERFFKSKLVGVDPLEMYMYIEIDYINIDIDAWIKKIGYLVLPKIMRIENEKR